MKNLAKTFVFLVVAAALVAAAWQTRPVAPSLAYFDDQGEPFYPEFTDPLAATTLEVVEFDEATGDEVPFKVTVREGRWTIPSHYDYPADGEDRLAQTASSIIDLRKDVVVSDRLQDHETLGVIDPLDVANAAESGRGHRVKLLDKDNAMLADFIIGRPVEDREGFRYVRLPDKKRTYAVKLDVDLSTRFADWIETNLLDVTVPDMTSVTIFDYSVDEAAGSVDMVGTLHLDKEPPNTWTLAELPEGEALDTAAVDRMTQALSNLTITGVRPKPASLTADLRTEAGLALDPVTQLSLRSMGYFVSQDGRLLSNEGEVVLGTSSGVQYTLRFGEVLYGEGEVISSGLTKTQESDGENESDAAGPENRYLFVTADFNEALLPPAPVAPTPPTLPETEPATGFLAPRAGVIGADARSDAGHAIALLAGAPQDTPPDSDEPTDPAPTPPAETDTPTTEPGEPPADTEPPVDPETTPVDTDSGTETEADTDSESDTDDATDDEATDETPEPEPDPEPEPEPIDPAILQAEYDLALVQYEEDLVAWEMVVEEGREIAARLNDRFAPWYFVISAADFQDIRLDLEKLIAQPATPTAP